MNIYETKSHSPMLRIQGYTVAEYTDQVIATDKSFDKCLNTIEGTCFKNLALQ